MSAAVGARGHAGPAHDYSAWKTLPIIHTPETSCSLLYYASILILHFMMREGAHGGGTMPLLELRCQALKSLMHATHNSAQVSQNMMIHHISRIVGYSGQLNARMLQAPWLPQIIDSNPTRVPYAASPQARTD
jgi:hypothetical protein